MYYPRNDFSSDFNSSPSNASKTTVVQIAAVLPQRKLVAIRSRLLRLTHPGRNKGEWTAKEIEQLLELHQQLGNAWTKIAKGLERLPESCRDKIRELTVVRDRETGTWSAAEEHLLGVACQKQWQLAGKDDDENQTIVKGIYRVGNTRDGIDWGIVSKQVGTRSPIQCTQKWYKNLRPNMKSTGEWSDGQDTELLQALWKRQPSSEGEVAWGNLVEGRNSINTRSRWALMRKHIPWSKNFELNQQILYLVAKFKPKLFKNADESGPYQVTPKAAKAALDAKKDGSDEKLCRVAKEIASSTQVT